VQPILKTKLYGNPVSKTRRPAVFGAAFSEMPCAPDSENNLNERPMPKTIRLRSIVPRTPTSQPQARLYTAVRKRANGWDRALPKWYTIERVKPEEGELLGFLHEERKRCGKENCRCTSGREEDLHGPYYYRRWRDEEGNQRREYVREEDVAEVQARIEKRRRRAQREREERKRWRSEPL
jgi:hypothetical protein